MLKVKEGRMMLINMIILFVFGILSLNVCNYWGVNLFYTIVNISIIAIVCVIGILQMILAFILLRSSSRTLHVDSKLNVTVIDNRKNNKE